MDALNGNMLRELRRCKVEFDRDGVIGSAWDSHAHKLRLKLRDMGYLKNESHFSTFFAVVITDKGMEFLKGLEK